MLELSRRSDRRPDDPLMQPDPRPRLKVIICLIVAAAFGFLIYNGFNRGATEAQRKFTPSAFVPAQNAPAAPYSALRSDQRTPELSNVERARRAAAARLEATGGRTANSSRLDTRTGNLTKVTPVQRLFHGLTTREQVNTAALTRLEALTAEVTDLHRFAEDRPDPLSRSMLQGVNALREAAATEVRTLSSADLPASDEIRARENAANALAQLETEIERVKTYAAAH